jgi:hypothetical protein
MLDELVFGVEEGAGWVVVFCVDEALGIVAGLVFVEL